MEYEAVVGLEIHCRIKTKTKMFCRCSNDIFNAEPNTHVCPICMGFPGMLPLMSEESIRKGIKGALALGCEIPEFSKMDRKSYFYPDLPLGYQISQYDLPVSQNGKVTITKEDGTTKNIGVTRLHLENDAGKLTHTAGGSLVDYNRSGTPLVEIVSEPDMRTREEVSLYARQIQKIMRYVGTSDADMEKGQMRFDLNISLRPKGSEKYGIRAEVKNLNSFRSLEKAFDYEFKRQSELLDKGEEVIQETRGWQDDKEVTVSQRGKEEAADYRYFPEPDIPPLIVTREMVEELRAELPELPEVKVKRYMEEGVPEDNAKIIAGDMELVTFFEGAVAVSSAPKKTSNFILSEVKPLMGSEEFKATGETIGKVVKLIEDGSITGKIAKDHLEKVCFENPDVEVYFEPFKVVEDTAELERICQEVIGRNEKVVADFKSGNEKAIGALVGQIMGATKGTANPKSVNDILRKLLS
jgi:aspartyl-tRNA(Asn)/glutamyl-tRNA(Gln) amidotransferase subunit B